MKVWYIMKLNDEYLKLIGYLLSAYKFKLNANEWFSEYQYMYVINDINNVNNEYRIIIDVDDNCVIFQYIDNETSDIIDLCAYDIAIRFCNTKCDLFEYYRKLIVSILDYYMHNESE